MPELPSVIKMKRSLQSIIGEKIQSIKIKEDDRLKKVDLGVENETIDDIVVKGKKLIFVLSDGYIMTSFGLFGEWAFKKDKYTTMSIDLYSGNVIYFNDKTHFGKVEKMKTLDDLNIGKTYLEISFKEFKDAIKMKPRMQLKNFLADQSIFSGLGRRLISDIFKRIDINSSIQMNQLSSGDTKQLFTAIQDALENYSL